ncbi:alpha/beta fold hydrolase [Nocardia sp. 2]|uniref:Alpha/beta fold hydrolase n=1 Tax=Nocardia acididurans TaxID=2802282 RepID=A0ABS1ML24_9NOCA|nr:alpha/beta hydrolase [Nocardia acididurans]MBL1079958.1 alpha/beta fold hydrolase [Nocardia acididurans]
MTKTAPALESGVTEGTLEHGLPYLALGSGRPLAFLSWFTPDHANPTGRMRNSLIETLRPFARDFRVYAINRAPGTAPGTTMADIAAQHAAALRAEFGEPVDVIGVSSGGSVALQLAVDHPDIVRTLVTISSGYRLEPHVRTAQLAYAEAVAAGRRGLHHGAPMVIASPWRARLAAAAMWLIDPFVRPRNPADTLAFVRAEDPFDLTGRLAEITAPALVLGGDRDAAYPVENLRRTAAGIPDGRAIVYRGATHMGVVKDPRLIADTLDFLTRE